MYIIVVFFETCAGLAQLVEQWNHNPRVIGPNPIPGTTIVFTGRLSPHPPSRREASLLLSRPILPAMQFALHYALAFLYLFFQ